MSFTDQELIDIYVNAPIEKDRFEVVKLEAQWFTETYFLQTTYSEVIEAEVDGVLQSLQYAPFETGGQTSSDELEYRVAVVIQYVNDLIAKQSDNFDPSLRGDARLPKVTIYEFISYRDGTFKQSTAKPITMRLNMVSRDEDGTSLEASTIPTNSQTTGEIVTTTRFPMLKAFQ